MLPRLSHVGVALLGVVHIKRDCVRCILRQFFSPDSKKLQTPTIVHLLHLIMWEKWYDIIVLRISTWLCTLSKHEEVLVDFCVGLRTHSSFPDHKWPLWVLSGYEMGPVYVVFCGTCSRKFSAIDVCEWNFFAAFITQHEHPYHDSKTRAFIDTLRENTVMVVFTGARWPLQGDFSASQNEHPARTLLHKVHHNYTTPTSTTTSSILISSLHIPLHNSHPSPRTP